MEKAIRSGHWLWLVLLFALCLPFLLREYHLNIAILALIYVGLSIAWNIVGGIAGQFSFAHSLFIGSGAYGAAIVYLYYGWSPWVGIFLGAAVAVLLGSFIAWLSFRFELPPLSFALITLAFAEIGVRVVMALDYFGAASGLAIRRENLSSFSKIQFLDSASYYYLILFFVVVFLLISIWIFRSKLGYYFRALRDNEAAAEAIGIDLLRNKIVAMIVSALLSAVIGGLYAQYLLYIDPRVFVGPHLIIEIVLFTAIGGIGTLWGPVVGPILLLPIGEIVRGKLAASLPGLHFFLYGALVVIVILYAPQGLMGWLKGISKSRGTRRLINHSRSA